MNAATRWRGAPYVLHEAPEIASVDVLGSVLRIALAVLRATNPEVEGLDLRGGCAVRPRAAKNVITHAESLLAALDCYRAAVECELRRPDRRVEDDDLPF